MTEQPKCDVCGGGGVIGVFACPLGPVSFAYCRGCWDGGHEPYGMWVAAFEIRGQAPSDAELAFHGKTREQFSRDVFQ